ncbi:MAG: hypothetical protein KC418_21925 [Anaerolineales bacterium]|nr:hypothetical protein [Anaerolineales bacterium]
MKQLQIHLLVKSDATFGRGEGLAGLVDQEIEHDTRTGLPLMRGRTLKGLLVEECANILYSLRQHPRLEEFREAAHFLFGSPGSTLEDHGQMLVGAAEMPAELRTVIAIQIQKNELSPIDVLNSLTAIRRQTSIDDKTGAPEIGSLRAMRVLLRETQLASSLDFEQEPKEIHLALLAACAAGLRRAGTGRNRGRGRLCVWLESEKLQADHLANFRQLVMGEKV